MSITNIAEQLTQKRAELAALRAAKLSFWKNGGVSEYSIEDRQVRYTKWSDMDAAERSLCAEIESLENRGGGNLVKFNAFC